MHHMYETAYNRLLCRILIQYFTSLIKKFDADVINMCVKLQLKLETHVTYCSYPFCFVGAVVFGFSSKIRLWLAGLLFLFLFYH